MDRLCPRLLGSEPVSLAIILFILQVKYRLREGG